MPDNLTLRQLRARARDRGVPNWQLMDKTQLRAALSKAETVYISQSEFNERLSNALYTVCASQTEFNVLYGAIQTGSELDD